MIPGSVQVAFEHIPATLGIRVPPATRLCVPKPARNESSGGQPVLVSANTLFALTRPSHRSLGATEPFVRRRRSSRSSMLVPRQAAPQEFDGGNLPSGLASYTRKSVHNFQKPCARPNHSRWHEFRGSAPRRTITSGQAGANRWTLFLRGFPIDVSQDHYTTMTLSFMRFTSLAQTIQNMAFIVPPKGAIFRPLGIFWG